MAYRGSSRVSLVKLCVLIATLLALSACSAATTSSGDHAARKPTSTPASSPTPAPSPTASSSPAGGVPQYDHIFWVMEENHSYGDIVGSSSAPYINETLIPKGSLATNDSAITHPSVNNYLADVSGQTYGGITDSCTPSNTSCSTNAWNLFDGLTASGKTWATYEESMPSSCYTSYQSGDYVERHDPAPYFNQIRDNASRCAQDKPFTSLATDLGSAATTPTFSFITPNVQNDMHDGTVNQADTWLKNNLPTVFNSPAWKTQHSLLILTEDENDGSAGNIVPLLFVSSDGSVPAGRTDSATYTQYDTLRTIEDSLGVTPGGPGDKAGRDETGMFG